MVKIPLVFSGSASLEWRGGARVNVNDHSLEYLPAKPLLGVPSVCLLPGTSSCIWFWVWGGGGGGAGEHWYWNVRNVDHVLNS